MPQRVRKIPMRTCVVCGLSCNKKELLRIIRTPSGTVEMDSTGKRSGRGAYLCSRSECRMGPQAAQRLSRALRTPIKGELLLGWFAEG